MVKFRPRGMVDKREMEQAQLFGTADERGCTPMFGAAHRRESAWIGGCRPPAVMGGFCRFVQALQSALYVRLTTSAAWDQPCEFAEHTSEAPAPERVAAG